MSSFHNTVMLSVVWTCSIGCATKGSEPTRPGNLLHCDSEPATSNCVSIAVQEHFPDGKDGVIGVWCQDSDLTPVDVAAADGAFELRCADAAWGIEVVLVLNLRGAVWNPATGDRWNSTAASGTVSGFVSLRGVPSGDVVDRALQASPDDNLALARRVDSLTVGTFRIIPNESEIHEWREISGDFRFSSPTEIH